MLLSLFLPLQAATIVVDPAGTGDATTIAAGITLAATGDTVEVVAGTYSENVDFGGKSIQLVGRDGSAATFLIGTGVGPVVRVDSGEAVGTALKGFTISGGNSTSFADTTNSGGGLYVSKVPIVLEDLEFKANTAYYGGGAFLSQAEGASISNCVFNANSGTVGAGLYIYGNTVSISWTTFENNASTNAVDKSYGGGGVFYSANVLADHVDFLRNSAGYFGGHLYTSAGTFSCDSCTFDSGSAYAGGGYFSYATTADFTSTTFTSNTVTSNGGGLETTNATILTMRRVTFDKNTASYGAGSLIANGTLTGSHLTYTNNTAAGGGGGIYSDAGTLDIRNSLFVSNTAAGANGGGIALDGGTATVTASIFSLNSASSGGGIHVNDGSAAVLTNLTLTENASTNSAGGVRVTALGTMTINSSVVAYSSVGSGISAADGSITSIQYGNLYGNASAPTSGGLVDPTGTNGNIAVDPMFVSFAADAAYLDDLHLAAGSGLIDAGDPTLFDADGSRDDIGAFGGPYGNAWDADLDTWTVEDGDCNDANAAIYPEATEACDGVDNNCDSIIDEGCETDTDTDSDTDTDTDSDTDTDTDADTDSDSDTDTSTDTNTGTDDSGGHPDELTDSGKDDGGGSCGCNDAGQMQGVLLILAGLVGMRRRKDLLGK